MEIFWAVMKTMVLTHQNTVRKDHCFFYRAKASHKTSMGSACFCGLLSTSTSLSNNYILLLLKNFGII